MKLDIFDTQRENEQSEMDFISKIFKLIRGNTETNSLKRRSDEKPDYSILTKYRRVNNEFPKYIERPFEDDNHILRAPPNVSVPLMSLKRRINERSATAFPMRKIKNFGELEYSDDEDDILQSRIPFTQNSFGANGIGRVPKYNLDQNAKLNEINPIYKTTSSIVHIPLRIQTTSGIPRPQVPPLIEARTGNIITSMPPNVPGLKPIKKSFLSNFVNSYGNNAQIIQANNNLMRENSYSTNASSIQHHHAQTLSSRRSSLNCMNGLSDSSPKLSVFRKQNAKNIAHSSNMINSPNTVVKQVYNIQQKEIYEELLKKVVPGLYNSKKSLSSTFENGIGSSDLNSNRKAQKGSSATKLIHDSHQFSTVIDRIDLTKSVKPQNSSKLYEPVITLDDDDDKGVIDLDAEDTSILAQYAKINADDESKKANVKEKNYALPYVDPINTLKEKHEMSPILQPLWLTQFKEKLEKKQKQKDQEIREATEEAKKSSEETERAQRTINEKLKNFRIAAETIIIDEEEEEEEIEFPELSNDDDTLIKKSIYRGSPDEVLVQKFNMSIRRRDIQTLVGDSWLNDEVINFYMNLLMERGEMRASEGYPKVYAMNTFFIPRLLSSGHSAVRRWTRKVDLFTFDIIPVPVHVGGVHWCMAIIHLKNKTIKYYDSMGTPNPGVLKALEQYLKDESRDKKGLEFDTTGFKKESVSDCPRQMNGSDCGVFSCMFAEYTTRNKNITFSQQHMQYFRHKMILEIVKGKLLL